MNLKTNFVSNFCCGLYGKCSRELPHIFFPEMHQIYPLNVRGVLNQLFSKLKLSVDFSLRKPVLRFLSGGDDFERSYPSYYQPEFLSRDGQDERKAGYHNDGGQIFHLELNHDEQSKMLAKPEFDLPCIFQFLGVLYYSYLNNLSTTSIYRFFSRISKIFSQNSLEWDGAYS